MTTKITFAHFGDLINNLQRLGDADTPTTPLEYAAHKLKKQWLSTFKNYQKRLQEETEDIEQDHIMLDEKRVPIKDEKGNYCISLEGIKARTKLIRALQQEEVEITLYFCKHPELVNALPLYLKAFYAGILFEWSEEEFEKSFEVPVLALNGHQTN